MKKILFLMAAVVFTVILAAGCANDSNNDSSTNDAINGLYSIDSISINGLSIPQDNATVRINSQDYQNVFALIDGMNIDNTAEEISFLIYGEKYDVLNIRYENGKYILPLGITVDNQSINCELVMTKVASYSVNTGIGNLRNIFKITANNGNSVSTNNGALTFNVTIETDGSATDFAFGMIETLIIKDGIYSAYMGSTTDSTTDSTTESTTASTTENTTDGTTEVTEDITVNIGGMDITWNLISQQNNTLQYEITINNPVDKNAAYILVAYDKNATTYPDNFVLTLVKQTTSTTSSN